MSTGPIAVLPPAGRLETTSEAPSERPSRVLLVVAEKEQRQALSALLGEEGYEVLPLSDADEVMRVTAEFEPDLVIVALGLPGASGLELCGELKASDARRPFPVLIVAFEECSEAAIAAGLLAGADDFAFGHTRPLELKARVRVQLRNKRHLDALTRLRSERDMLRRDAEIDGLTGLLNRRALVREVSRQRDGCRRFGVLFIDVDHFKSINDLQGHQAGDSVLVAVAELLKECLRPGDAVGRYGGEEFVALIDGAGPESLRLVAERLRASVEVTPLGPELTRISVSIGAAVFDPRGAESPEELLNRADSALYRAKADGRNCVVLEQDGRSGHPPGSIVGLDAARLRRAPE
jgi:two-component system, cell cycle response regulator